MRLHDCMTEAVTQKTTGIILSKHNYQFKFDTRKISRDHELTRVVVEVSKCKCEKSGMITELNECLIL